MKIKRTLVLLATLAVVVNLHASAPASDLPEFMNAEQLAKWNADQEAANKTATASKEAPTIFFTSKPYVDGMGYVFKYRTYNPEMARWTTADPSGFPDGANNHIYAPCPTSEMDPNGLLTITGTTTPDPASQPAQYNDGNYTITATPVTTISTDNTISGTLNIQYYRAALTSASSGGVSITIYVSGVQPIADTVFKWIQIITTNTPGSTGNGGAYYDNSGGSTPFYTGQSSSTYFYDTPSRSVQLATPGNPITWTGDLEYVGLNTVTGAITNYGGIEYGFTISE